MRPNENTGTQRIACRTVLLAAGLLAPLAAPAAAQEALDALRAQTVQIKVTQPGNPVEYGSGVVLCQENKQVFVLTAHHVFAGKSPQPSGKNTLRFRRISSAEISFYGNSPPPVGKDALTVYQVPDEDLLLLSFPLEQVLPSATLDTPAVVDESAEEEDRPRVISVGYWKDRAQAWAHREGSLLPGGGKLVHHSGQIAEGFSGGPLFNEAGSLIAINIERVAGEAIGAGAGKWYGEALAVEAILPAIDKWVPSKCLESASPLSELAYLTYRTAMRAVSIKRWPQAEELMAQALEQQPIEGGSVHLEGLRYTPYLPLYHRGLALYKLAGRAEDSARAAEYYSQAIRHWERSEAQGVIQGNKRYKTLKRLKEKSYRQLQRQSRPETGEAESPSAQESEESADRTATETATVEEEAADAAKVAEEQATEMAAAETQTAEAAKVAQEQVEEQAEAAQSVAQAQAAAEEQAGREKARAAEAAARAQAELEAKAVEERARQEAAAEAERAALHRVVASAEPCARVRSEPSAGAAVVQCLEPGVTATLLSVEGEWSRLRFASGREGWMASWLLEPVDASEKQQRP